MEALVVTPVKDSPETTRRTIEAISVADGNFEYVVFNDFSSKETRDFLENNQELFRFRLINLEDYIDTPSPNYKTVLEMSQEMALKNSVPLILIESDVIIKKNTITELLRLYSELPNPGSIGAVTVDQEGNHNFPYSYVRKDNASWQKTKRSLSFCCTLISPAFLGSCNFKELSGKKDWYDIHISRQSLHAGFYNYLVKELSVLHLPHSSRPWKQLKYTHPIRYYFYKLTRRRDRI